MQQGSIMGKQNQQVSTSTHETIQGLITLCVSIIVAELSGPPGDTSERCRVSLSILKDVAPLYLIASNESGRTRA